ncbi:MAG TPA: hypothetical protein VFD01_05575 [Candidatus Dormibacteraeota bacterium]|jgi:uncharacterized phage infection (PIP) family protein YhgE|nr:hypothetical protein [Candidatus Dormibacteraeota bacterium]
MGDENDPLVRLSDGRIMRLSEFKRLQQQEIQAFVQQMTVTIESLGRLSSAMDGEAGEVWNAKWQLDTDLAGIEQAIGTDDTGQKFRAAWKESYGQLLEGFDAVAQNLINLRDSLSSAADQLFKTESDTLKGFGMTAVDPRPKPSKRRPTVC